MNKIAIYVRVSTNHQIDKDSLPLQRKELKNYCKYILNSDEFVVFEDAGYSAKNTDRPDFQKMMTRIRKNEFTHLLVWKIDRISRNLLDFCDMYNELKKYNCTFVSKNEQFDTSSAMGEAMLKIILVFAELERKLTAERVSAVMLDRASKGLWNGAPIPLGYKWCDENKFPVVHEEEAKTVKLIYDMYLKEKSTSALRNYLNSNHIKTKRDGTWTTRTVASIIRNSFYKGTYVYNKRDYTDEGKQKLKDKKEWIVLEDNHKGIVDLETWTKANEIMDKNAERNNAHFRENSKTHVFANLLECGECHNNLYSKQDKPNQDGFVPSFYWCSGRYNNLGCNQKTISENTIGKFIYNYMSDIIKTSNNSTQISYEDFECRLMGSKYLKGVKAIEGLYDLYNNMYKKTDKFEITISESEDCSIEVGTLNAEKKKYERALNRLEDLYLFDDETMSEKDYLIKKNRINEKLNEVTNKLKSLSKSEVKNEDFFKLGSNLLLNDLLLNESDFDNKKLILNVGRDILKEFVNITIEKIYIKDKQITGIKFKNGIENKFIYS